MSNAPTHPRVLKDILLGVSLCAVIFGLLFAVPLLGVFALLVLPLPVLFYRLKLGRNCGAIVAAASLAFVFLLSRELAFDTLYFGSLLFTGLCLGECLERQFGIQKTMIVTTLSVIGLAFLAFALYTVVTGQNMGTVVSEYLSRYFKLTAEVYSEMGIAENQIKMMNRAFLMVLPGLFLISYLSTVWMNILIIRKLLLRKGIHLKNVANLSRFRAPDYMVWAVILFGLSLMLPSAPFKVVSGNCLIVLMLLYFFQGIAVVSFFFQKKNSPVFLRVFCYFLIAIQVYFLLLVIGVGFFDNWINFRKLDTTTR